MKERNVNFVETHYTCKFEICVSNYDVAKAWQFSPWKIILLDYSSWKKGMSSLWKHITLKPCKFEICVLNYDLIKALIFSQFMKERNVKFVKIYYTKTMQIWQLCLKLWSSQSLEIQSMKDNYFIQQFVKGKMSSLWKHITLKQCKREIFVSN